MGGGHFTRRCSRTRQRSLQSNRFSSWTLSRSVGSRLKLELQSTRRYLLPRMARSSGYCCRSRLSYMIVVKQISSASDLKMRYPAISRTWIIVRFLRKGMGGNILNSVGSRSDIILLFIFIQNDGPICNPITGLRPSQEKIP